MKGYGEGIDGIPERECWRMRACVGLGGGKRRQERGEVVTEQICKHRTLLTTYTHILPITWVEAGLRPGAAPR